MGAWLESLASAPHPPLWLDDTAYSERLLAGGAAPWLDVSAFLSWRQKAQGLLRPDVTSLALGPLIRAWVEANPSLRTSMATQRRVTAPLRALLGEDALRRYIVSVLKALRASSSLPLALVLSSPRRWVAEAHEMAFGEPLAVEEEDTDSASVYLSDFLRSFGECGLDVLLLEEDAASAPAGVEQIDWYQSVVNLARHYRWDVGLRTPRELPGESGLDFLIAPEGAKGVEVGQAFWSGGEAPAVAAGGFRHAVIPPDAEPRAVLERLSDLR